MRALLFLFCLICSLTIAQDAAEKPTTLILIRHAERGNDGSKDPPLAEAGITRANNLVNVFKNTDITAIYSSDYKRTKNTAAPVAQAKGLETKIYEPMKEEEIKRIIAENKGKTVLVVGHSNTTPWTASFLTGNKLKDFADTDYGNILIVTVWDGGKTSMTWVNY
jgi:2,3-bisphosphoglycerate-dependent phosphoglycerate mutase